MMAIASFAMGVWATYPFTSTSALRGALDACVEDDASGATCTYESVDIKDWNISGVTSLRKMFTTIGDADYSSFNADISSWIRRASLICLPRFPMHKHSTKTSAVGIRRL